MVVKIPIWDTIFHFFKYKLFHNVNIYSSNLQVWKSTSGSGDLDYCGLWTLGHVHSCCGHICKNNHPTLFKVSMAILCLAIHFSQEWLSQWCFLQNLDIAKIKVDVWRLETLIEFLFSNPRDISSVSS